MSVPCHQGQSYVLPLKMQDQPACLQEAEEDQLLHRQFVKVFAILLVCRSAPPSSAPSCCILVQSQQFCLLQASCYQHLGLDLQVQVVAFFFSLVL